MAPVNEISAAELERELRAGAPVAVLDVRPTPDVRGWPLDAGEVPLVAVPFADLARALPLSLRDGRPVRVICARGNTSRRAASDLARRGIPATSVAGGIVAWGRLLVAAPVATETHATVIQFRREARGCLSYLVAAGGAALVVDPAPDAGPYLAEADRLGVRIGAILDTHVHADHVSAARALQDETGATLHLSRAALARGLRYAPRVSAVADGDRIGPPGADALVVALPGHTTDNVGVLVGGRALIAGDSLFRAAVARPELESGIEGAADAARRLHRTLQKVIRSLPSDTILLPCHYPGGRLAEPEWTTVGTAVAALPLLALAEDGFVAAVLRDLPPRPANYEAIIAVNVGIESADDAGLLEVGANNCAAGPGLAA